MRAYFRTGMGILITGLLLTGCLTTSPEQRRVKNQSNATQASDTYLAKAFLAPGFSSEQHVVQIFRSSIALTDSNVTIGDSPNDCIRQYFKLDSSQDIVARHYTQTVKGRGNMVKQYSAKLNAKIRRMFKTPTLSRNDYGRFDLDPVLIEHDKTGGIVSVLVRFNEFSSPLASTFQTQYSAIYFGENARYIESRLNARLLADNFMRDR